MRVTTCFGDDILPHDKKARAILGYLCLAAGARVSRTRLAGLLWDRISEAAARINLCRALHELASTFGTLAHELIAFEHDNIKLDTGACWVDALAALALDQAPPASPPIDPSVICRGQLLEGLDGASASFDEWLLAERARIAKRLQPLAESASAAPGAPKSVPQGSALQHSWLSAPSGRSRLRVGVLPLMANGSGREQRLAVSLSQQITAALARLRWFDVIAAISPRCVPSNHFVNEHQIRHMNLDYLVDWAISCEEGNTQIKIDLLKFVEPARLAWSGRFDLARGELDRLGELVTSRIVDCIDPIVPFIERQRRRNDHYGAAGLLLLAIPLMFSMEREKYEQAGRLIGQALDVDPDNSAVSAWAAHWHLFYSGQRWAHDLVRTNEITKKHALKAMKLDPQNADVLSICGHICSILDKDFDSAHRHFDRALRLNPSLATTWSFSALTSCYAGEPDAALPKLDRYRELAPFDAYSSPHEIIFAIAHVFKGDYERAALAGRRVVEASPSFVAAYKPLIASLGHLGRRDEAKPYVDKLLALEPNFTVESFAEVYPIKKASDRKRYMEGLHLAGVPAR